MDYDFGICVSGKLVTVIFQLTAKLAEVVYFSVEDGPASVALVENWLMTACKIDDAETAHTKAGTVFDKDAFIVWAAMNDCLAHAVNQSMINPTIIFRANDSRDSAHASALQNQPWLLQRLHGHFNSL